MAAVHQFLPVLSTRDAIGAHALALRDALRGRGHESEIWVENVAADAKGEARPYHRFPEQTRSDTVLVYQGSIGSDIAPWLVRRREPLVLNYHNVTPPEVFVGWEPSVVVELVKGRRQLAQLAARTTLGVAVSEFNASDLRRLGVTTEVAPVIFDPARLGGSAEPATLAALDAGKSKGGSDLLFVGRISPNKAQHDVIKAFAAYRRLHDPLARLHLVGGVSSDSYDRTLRALARSLGCHRSVNLTGSVTSDQLSAYFCSAELFACCSDHEGFGVPLLEAMHVGVPVVAYAAAAVPETVGNAALLLDSKDPITVAAAWNRVLSDDALRCALVERGRARLDSLDPVVACEKLVRMIEAVASS